MEQKRLPIFAERFSNLRGEITQGEFAEFLGISRPTVGFYENGSRLPDALVLRQIAEKCEVSTDWLLGLSLDRKRNATAIDELGLSEVATNMILKYRNEFPSMPYVEVLNALLGHERFPRLLLSIINLLTTIESVREEDAYYLSEEYDEDVGGEDEDINLIRERLQEGARLEEELSMISYEGRTIEVLAGFDRVPARKYNAREAFNEILSYFESEESSLSKTVLHALRNR